MLRVLVHLVGHRARPSVAWPLAVVLATTGGTRRCPAGSTNVGRPAFARPPRIRRWPNRLTQLTKLQLYSATLRGSDEETIACGAPADSEKKSTHYCAAQVPVTNTIAENQRQLTRRWREVVAIHLLFLRQPGMRHKLEDTIGNHPKDHWSRRSNDTNGGYEDPSLGMETHTTWQLGAAFGLSSDTCWR